MWFIALITYLAFLIQTIFATISIAAGLYYLAELVEEYTVLTKKLIWWSNSVILVLYLCLWIFEKFPHWMMFFGTLAQIVHFVILQDFPYVSFISPTFIIGIILLAINHYLAFAHFSRVFYTFSEVMAYFTLFLWVVPFALLISLSANENVLPTTTDQDGRDIVTNYFSKKKKYGLLAFFNYMKESLLSRQNKKGF
ncbi:hypothetical protein AMK59_7001 [Oryctes borbonicus]|uniref:Protein TEX261 n=1 Tax=Oryctes borbonicus TaxID=1629725 RepID=A0A0T6AZH1_9SCAR|nr:hypothetical protein AMK59_7001 [Oryctes borbonicus]